MIDLNAIAKVNRQVKSYYRKPSEKQIELAKDLGHTEPEKETVHTLSLWIDKAVAAQKEASEKAFDEANEYDFLTLAERHTELRKDSQYWYSGPCPMAACKSTDDGFFVNAKDNRGGCRQCNWNGDGYGSGPVGFIAALMTLEAWQARDYILGKGLDVDLPPIERKKREKKTKQERIRQDFADVQHQAYERLYSGDDLASFGLDYYAKRGIKLKTLTHYGIGVCRDYGGRDFVCAPYFSDADLILCAIRYSNEKISRKGSIFGASAFGLDCIRGHELSVIVEGENNALAIWQALDELGYEADVLSVGSESAMTQNLDILTVKRLKRAKTLLLWADKETVSEQAAKNAAKYRPDLTIHCLNSGEIEGKKGKTDANDLLLAGYLASVLKHVLPVAKSAKPVEPIEPVKPVELVELVELVEPVEPVKPVELVEPVEQGREPRLELLSLCSAETERIGTQEADTMYCQAETICQLGSITALYEHLGQMKALPSKQESFEQNRLFGQNELDDDRSIADEAIETANSRAFTNALMIAKQIKDGQLRRRTIGQIKHLKKAA